MIYKILLLRSADENNPSNLCMCSVRRLNSTAIFVCPNLDLVKRQNRIEAAQSFPVLESAVFFSEEGNSSFSKTKALLELSLFSLSSLMWSLVTSFASNNISRQARWYLTISRSGKAWIVLVDRRKAPMDDFTLINWYISGSPGPPHVSKELPRTVDTLNVSLHFLFCFLPRRTRSRRFCQWGAQRRNFVKRYSAEKELRPCTFIWKTQT